MFAMMTRLSNPSKRGSKCRFVNLPQKGALTLYKGRGVGPVRIEGRYAPTGGFCLPGGYSFLLLLKGVRRW
jgi:hypothetical protein